MSADSTVRHARVKGMPDTSGATARSYAGAGPSGADGPIGPPAMNADADRPRTAHRTGGGAADGASDGGAEGGTIASIIEAWRQDRFEVALSEHIYDEAIVRSEEHTSEL